MGESPTFLHADLTLRADPAVSAQFEKKTKRPSTVARVHTTHTTRAMRAFEPCAGSRIRPSTPITLLAEYTVLLLTLVEVEVQQELLEIH